MDTLYHGNHFLLYSYSIDVVSLFYKVIINWLESFSGTEFVVVIPRIVLNSLKIPWTCILHDNWGHQVPHWYNPFLYKFWPQDFLCYQVLWYQCMGCGVKSNEYLKRKTYVGMVGTEYSHTKLLFSSFGLDTCCASCKSSLSLSSKIMKMGSLCIALMYGYIISAINTSMPGDVVILQWTVSSIPESATTFWQVEHFIAILIKTHAYRRKIYIWQKMHSEISYTISRPL